MFKHNADVLLPRWYHSGNYPVSSSPSKPGQQTLSNTKELKFEHITAEAIPKPFADIARVGIEPYQMIVSLSQVKVHLSSISFTIKNKNGGVQAPNFAIDAQISINNLNRLGTMFQDNTNLNCVLMRMEEKEVYYYYLYIEISAR